MGTLLVMGYYTYHELCIFSREGNKLTLLDRGPEIAIIDVLRKEYESAKDSIDDHGCTNNHTKWYNHADDLKAFSKKYPEYVFRLHGNGEDSDDRWYHYFLNGKMQVANCEFVYQSFDVDELE